MPDVSAGIVNGGTLSLAEMLSVSDNVVEEKVDMAKLVASVLSEVAMLATMDDVEVVLDVCMLDP